MSNFINQVKQYFQQYFQRSSIKMNAILIRMGISVLLLSTIIKFSWCKYQQIKIDQQVKNQDQYEPQKKQYELQEQFKNQIEQQLNQWVVKQLSQNQQYPQVQPHQQILFMLQSNVTQAYRIPGSINQKILIEVAVFENTNEGQITFPQNPSQQNFIQLYSKDKQNDVQQREGIVYISKVFQIKFTQKHKYLKFKNRAQRNYIVLLSLEKNELSIGNIVGDNKFSLTKNKMDAILQQSKNTQLNREHLYKWQWGFYQKHERHQTDMLGFTAAELFIIFGTSIVQMYCIRNMIDHQLII